MTCLYGLKTRRITLGACCVPVGPNDYQVFQKISSIEYEFPDQFPADAKDLVQKLLVRFGDVRGC